MNKELGRGQNDVRCGHSRDLLLQCNVLLSPPSVVSNFLSAFFVAPKHGTDIFIELATMTLRSFFLRCDS